MRIGVDTSVLVRAHLPNLPRHEDARVQGSATVSDLLRFDLVPAAYGQTASGRRRQIQAM